MKEKKKHLKHLFFAAVLFLFSYELVQAQPTCWSNFEPRNICDQEILTKEFIFIGRVISIKSVPNTEYRNWSIAVIDVETQIKGEVKKQVELLVDRGCFGKIHETGRYIFTADIEPPLKVTSLFTGKWSYSLEEVPPDKLDSIITDLRSIVKGEKQARIVGYIGRSFYLDLQDWQAQDIIGGRSTYTKFDTDFRTDRPFEGIGIIAKRKDGQEFTTESDINGTFQFKTLPNGEYEIIPILPEKYMLITYRNFGNQFINSYLNIDDNICSKRIQFSAAIVGTIGGRISNLKVEKIQDLYLNLTKIDKSGIRDVFKSEYYSLKDFPYLKTDSGLTVEFKIPNILVGKYTLFISNDGKRIFYPGVYDINQATVIEVKPNETAEINYSFPVFKGK